MATTDGEIPPPTHHHGHHAQHGVHAVPTFPWDEAEGVWVGERAPSTHSLSELPRPVYVFGYGSLIWRPGPLLARCASFRATAIGYQRMFAQRSCDHRGTRAFPGVVLNLVRDDLLQRRGYRHVDDCHGLIWLVPEESVAEVLDDLDYRERGGYHRHLVAVRLAESSSVHAEGEIVQAVVYTAHESNPLFFLPSAPSARDIITNYYSAYYNNNNNDNNNDDDNNDEEEDVFFLRTRSAVVDLISSAIGPSGPNIEYLFRLHEDLRERGMGDSYIRTLVQAVRMRIGVWRGRTHLLTMSLSHTQNTQQCEPLKCVPVLPPVSLFGFGSNCSSQIESRSAQMQTGRLVPGERRRLYEPHAVSVTDSLPPSLTRALSRNPERVSLPWTQLEHVHVVAGASSSAVLWRDESTQRDCACVWGGTHILRELLNAAHCKDDSCGRDHSRIVGSVDEDCVVVIRGVRGVALGKDYVLLLTERGKLLASGRNTHEQCDVPRMLRDDTAQLHHSHTHYEKEKRQRVFVLDVVERHTQRNPFREGEGETEEGGENANASVLKVVAGEEHCAAITTDGTLVLWGEADHVTFLNGRKERVYFEDEVREEEEWIDDALPQTWCAPHGRKLIDVSCGLKHTLCVDDHGVVYFAGCDSPDELGRFGGDYRFEPVDIPSDVRVQKVSSGREHNVARGVTANGDVVFYAWGNCNLSNKLDYLCEYPRYYTNKPTLLRSFPSGSGAGFADVWCGGEFIVAVDDQQGHLWSCGHDHAKSCLKLGYNFDFDAGTWREIKKLSYDPLAVNVWEGSVACGCHHVIAIAEFAQAFKARGPMRALSTMRTMQYEDDGII